MVKTSALAIFVMPLLCCGQATISVLAGTGNPPNTPGAIGDGGSARSAFLDGPESVTVDAAGNVFIRESARVRKVTPGGIISTVAGNGTTGFSGDGGPGTSARIGGGTQRASLATDSAGNLYIADTNNYRVRRVTPAGIITTVAGNGQIGSGVSGDGNQATNVALCFPSGVAVDSTNHLYIGSSICGGGVRKVDLSTGIITTVARNSAGLAYGVAVDSAGNLYINAGAPSSQIRKVTPSGTLTVVAGTGTGTAFSGDGGPATSAPLFEVDGMAVDGAGNLFIADSGSGHARIRKVDPSGIITTVAGRTGNGNCPDLFFNGCPATDLQISANDVAVDASGNLYTAAFIRGLVYKISGGSTPGPGTTQPAITSVVNSASLQTVFGANSWVTIFGSNLASGTNTWNDSIVNGNLPTSVDGVSVSIGGRPAYVYFISPGQINALAPDVVSGTVSVTVTTGAGTSAPFTATANVYAPALFAWPGSQPVATRQDYSFVAKPGTFAGATTVAAKSGEVLILWATGLGPTFPAAPLGVAVPGDRAYPTSLTRTVTINDVSATVYGAALASGSAGLYQIAIQVPDAIPDGDWTIRTTIGGVRSPTGVLLTERR
jgi:uncharacterized protein (TIGR03437 family)